MEPGRITGRNTATSYDTSCHLCHEMRVRRQLPSPGCKANQHTRHNCYYYVTQTTANQENKAVPKAKPQQHSQEAGADAALVLARVK
jgi:hypothetical protein